MSMSTDNIPETPTRVSRGKKEPRSPGKRKKDYVFKFWAALHQRCAPLIAEFNEGVAQAQQAQQAQEQQQQTQQQTQQVQNGANSIDVDRADRDEMKMDEKESHAADGMLGIHAQGWQSSSSTNGNVSDSGFKSSDEDFHMREASSEHPPHAVHAPRGLTFDKLGAFMGNKQLIALVAKFWAVLQAYIKNEPIGKESVKDARVLLSTLMIAMFPHDVLDVSDISDMDALGEACYNAAQEVLKQVLNQDPNAFRPESAVHPVQSESNSNDADCNQTKFQCEQAYKCISKFLNAFKDWQSQDKTKILGSVLNFYEQWQRSYAVLRESSMNEAQKEGILRTINANIANCKKKMAGLVGNDEMTQLCNEIDTRLANEAAAVAAAGAASADAASAANSSNASNGSNRSNSATSANINNEASGSNGAHAANGDVAMGQSDESASETSGPRLSVEEQLRARGVPVNIKTGRNLVQGTGGSSSSSNGSNGGGSSAVDDEKHGEASKYVTKDENGNSVLNLDAIIMEEASKKYWNDFEKDIEKENWSRLFELLTELLQRIKKLSPRRDHKNLDDMIDVSFIQQTITNGMLDASGFYSIFHGIWKQLRSLHAPAKDKEWDAWHDKILKDMSATDATWAKLLSQVFNTFLLKVDEVEDQVAVINAIRDQQKSNGK